MSEIIIVDYGMGNIKSIQRGLEKIGASVKVSLDPDQIANADRVILPGVGAFKDGMMGLDSAGIVPALNAFVNTGRPLLGICLGMQMLLDKSEEHGIHNGLGYISGVVKKIPQQIEADVIRKIPHIGWNKLRLYNNQLSLKTSVLKNSAVDNSEGSDGADYFYFVHSYMALPKDKDDILALCEYEGISITAAIQKDNVTGLQFHPEKSCGAGLRVLHQFMVN